MLQNHVQWWVERPNSLKTWVFLTMTPFFLPTQSGTPDSVQVNENPPGGMDMYSKPAISSQMNLEGALMKGKGKAKGKGRGSRRRQLK